MEPLKGASWGRGGVVSEELVAVRAAWTEGTRVDSIPRTCWGVAAGGWYTQEGLVVVEVVVGPMVEGAKETREGGRVGRGGLWVVRLEAWQGGSLQAVGRYSWLSPTRGPGEVQ